MTAALNILRSSRKKVKPKSASLTLRLFTVPLDIEDCDAAMKTGQMRQTCEAKGRLKEPTTMNTVAYAD